MADVIASQQQENCDPRKVRRKAKDREKIRTEYDTSSSNSHDDYDDKILLGNTRVTTTTSVAIATATATATATTSVAAQSATASLTTPSQPCTDSSKINSLSPTIIQQQPISTRRRIFGRRGRGRRTSAYSTLEQSDDNHDDDIIMQETDDGTLMIVDRNYLANASKRITNKNNSHSSPTTKRQLSDEINVNDNQQDNNSNATEIIHQKTNTNENSSTRTSAPATVRQRLLTIAGIAGNILEWYDFAVFGYFSDILGEVFFPPPSSSQSLSTSFIDNNNNVNAVRLVDHTQTIDSFLVFGVAFIVRPIGGIIIGYIGDKYGRRIALIISIFLMAIPTFCMGCLPSYNVVGYWAPIFLIIIRIVQGLSVGGQLMSSLVYTLENQPIEHWGFYGSFVMAAANV
jgi:Sugar (and other) transporter